MRRTGPGREERKRMIEFSIEVRNGAARFDVALRAESTERALDLAERLYPGREVVRAKFPRGTEGPFAAGPARAGMVERPEKLAA
jgi:hypothetical protein